MRKISVIIPCFNVTRWLPKCFLSLAQQTIGINNLELIFVNDASTDEGATWDLLLEIERAYPENVILIDLSENKRQGGARNEGLKFATGEYISFVDADDWVESDLYATAYKRAKEEDAQIVQFNHSIYIERASVKKRFSSFMQDEVIHISTVEERKEMLVSEKISYGCWNKLYKRDLIEQANVRFAEHVVYEEPLFVYPLLYYADNFSIMKNALYIYRQNEEGTMYSRMKDRNTLFEHAEVQLATWKFMKNTSYFHDFYEEMKMYFLHTYLYETLHFARLRNFDISLKQFRSLVDTAMQEVADYDESVYAAYIPRQMELYQKIRRGITEKDIKEYTMEQKN